MGSEVTIYDVDHRVLIARLEEGQVNFHGQILEDPDYDFVFSVEVSDLIRRLLGVTDSDGALGYMVDHGAEIRSTGVTTWLEKQGVTIRGFQNWY